LSADSPLLCLREKYVFLHHVTVHYKYLVFMNLDPNVLIDVQMRHPIVLVTAGINLSNCSKATFFFPWILQFPYKVWVACCSLVVTQHSEWNDIVCNQTYNTLSSTWSSYDSDPSSVKLIYNTLTSQT